jgi:hypothetical protein
MGDRQWSDFGGDAGDGIAHNTTMPQLYWRVKLFTLALVNLPFFCVIDILHLTLKFSRAASRQMSFQYDLR